jgi:hypothetical protein
MHTASILAILAFSDFIEALLPVEIGTLVDFSLLEQHQLLAPRNAPSGPFSLLLISIKN